MKKWIAVANNIIYTEEETKWNEIDKEVSSLLLENNEQTISLPRLMDQYIQGKSASCIIGSNKIDIESRYIGFIYGNIKVIVRVDEKTNNINLEIEKVNESK